MATDMQLSYRFVNNAVGWLIFLISFFVLLTTMAPTSSFWDCGEFIACSNELQVPHPPGAPFYLVLGRFFALFAGGNPLTVAWWINIMSILASAFTVQFIFWTVTHLAKKILLRSTNQINKEQTVVVMVAGAVAALACSFSDSFWFNAVEAEVYAMSSFFTAAVVWLMFKWEDNADKPHNLRYIVLIALVMGVSIGVHLLNLLTIPALAVIYYNRKFKSASTGNFILGLILTLIISVFILGVVQYGLIQLSVDIAWALERWFTGTEDLVKGTRTGMGAPMGTGILILTSIVVIGMVVLLVIAQRIKSSILSTIVLSCLMIYVGYASYAMIVIRANANTNINENKPANASSFLSYLKREQYGDRPLFSGPLYNNLDKAKQVEERKAYIYLDEHRTLKDGTYKLEDGKTLEVKKGKAIKFTAEGGDSIYTTRVVDGPGVEINTKTGETFRTEDRYTWNGYKQDVEYDSRYKVIFPRMHSGSHWDKESHNFGYERYLNDRQIGNPADPYDDKPTKADDVAFAWDYQFMHMYVRYFLWNFVGREGDEQDMGWESGVNFRKTADMPEDMRNWPGKNHYFFLPLLLGLFGLVWQMFARPKDGFGLMLLFFFTGIAIIIYLNQTPSQPRERDYSYVGSFQTFCIWIGLGVIGLYDLLRDLIKKAAMPVVSLLSLGVPVLMLVQNYDDHNRHYQYIPPDSAWNLLNSCAKNAIIFTNGDNDTFPLWYLQEVEGLRTDVRVVNLSLLNTDWYIDQMKQQANDSPPLPISLRQEEYIGEKNSFLRWKKKSSIPLQVNRDAVLANGTVKKEFANRVLSPMVWNHVARGAENNAYILKQDWLIMDIVINNAANGWERPIYFSSTIPPSSYINLQEFFQVEGLAYRVVPVALPQRPNSQDPYRTGWVDKEASKDLIMNGFKYRELDREGLYLDEHIRRTIVGNVRSTIYRTVTAFIDDAEALENTNTRDKMAADTLRAKGRIQEADSILRRISARDAEIASNRKSAEELADFAEAKMPITVTEADPYFALFMGTAYQRLKNHEKSDKYYNYLVDKACSEMDFYAKYKRSSFFPSDKKGRYLSALGFLHQNLRRDKKWNPELFKRNMECLLEHETDAQTRAMIQQDYDAIANEAVPVK
jgi:hypothetical protein